MTSPLSSDLVMGIDPAIGPDTTTYVLARRSGSALEILETGRFQKRIVRSSRRKRTLRRRGESIGWDMELGAWTWYMRRPS